MEIPACQYNFGYAQPFHEDFLQINCFDSILLGVVTAGSGTITYRNSFRQSFPAGTAFLLDCREPIEMQTEQSGWSFKWLHFCGIGDNGLPGAINGESLCVIRLPDPSEMDAEMIRIEKVLLGNSQYRELELMVALDNMLSIVLRSKKATVPAAISYSRKTIEHAQDYIQKNYARPITVKDMADTVCISEYHFIRQFKQVSGMSPYAYLVLFRLNVAMTLLQGSQKSVNDIAHETGFANAKSFSRFFKQKYGITPSDYIRKWRDADHK